MSADDFVAPVNNDAWNTYIAPILSAALIVVVAVLIIVEHAVIRPKLGQRRIAALQNGSMGDDYSSTHLAFNPASNLNSLEDT